MHTGTPGRPLIMAFCQYTVCTGRSLLHRNFYRGTTRVSRYPGYPYRFPQCDLLLEVARLPHPETTVGQRTLPSGAATAGGTTTGSSSTSTSTADSSTSQHPACRALKPMITRRALRRRKTTSEELRRIGNVRN
eukprot:160225-Rhodomonas_salina.1